MCLPEYGNGLETSPDDLCGAGIPGRRDRTAYAGQHGRAADDDEGGHGWRVRLPATALQRTYAELPRSRRLHHRLCSPRFADLDSRPGRVAIARLRFRPTGARRYFRETRTVATHPRSLTLFAG